MGECSLSVFEWETTVRLHIRNQRLSVPCEGCKNSPCITVSFISSIKGLFFPCPLEIPTQKTCMQIKVGSNPKKDSFSPLMASFLSSCLLLWSWCESDDCYSAVNPAWLWHYPVIAVAETFMCRKKEKKSCKFDVLQ